MTNLRQRMNAFGVIACLFLYFVGSVEVESLHEISHDNDQTEVHTVEAEADPCHITVYHRERSGSCEHPTHVSKSSKCSFCDIQLHSSHLVFCFEIELSQLTLSSFTSHSEQDLVSEPLPYLKGRAPPIV